ncbi:MAG: phenylalanine--tRNA ligase subunit alpha, partial [bacterium]
MQTQIDQLREQATAELRLVDSEQKVDEFRIKFLSRNGLIAALFSELKNVPATEKPLVGKLLNSLRQETQSAFDEKAASLKASPKLSSAQDLTL